MTSDIDVPDAINYIDPNLILGEFNQNHLIFPTVYGKNIKKPVEL